MTTNIEQAIKFSIEGGYNFEGRTAIQIISTRCEFEVFLDKNFWICLGKKLGWGDAGESIPKTETRGYMIQWHSFIDALSRDETAEEFMGRLLDNK